MDKNTLSSYGWIVILVLVLSVMIALATPFGQFIASGVKSTTQGFFDVQQKALGIVGLNIGNQNFGDTEGGGGSEPVVPGYNHDAPELHPNDGTTPTINTVYTTEDYEYCYCAYWNGSRWQIKGDMNGWGVRVLDKTKSEYGPILESINGKPVTYIYSTFSGCSSLINAPVMPRNAVDMTSAFSDCVSLKTIPNIPQGVTTLYNTFKGCRTITSYEGSSAANGDFSGYVIPEGVINMTGTFREANLVIAPAVPSTVITLNYAFYNNTRLTTAPIIPNGVTSMESAFTGCSMLTTYHGSTAASGDFSGWVIPGTVTTIYSAFQATGIKVAPHLSEGIQNIGMAFANNQNIITAGTIPSTVTNMQSAFANCRNLSGTVVINANPASYSAAFMVSNGTAPQLTVTGSSTMLNAFTDDSVGGYRVIVVG